MLPFGQEQDNIFISKRPAPQQIETDGAGHVVYRAGQWLAHARFQSGRYARLVDKLMKGKPFANI